MKPVLPIDKKIDHLLKQMAKAMPEVKRQVEVYERNLNEGKLITTSQTSPQFKNV